MEREGGELAPYSPPLDPRLLLVYVLSSDLHEVHVSSY